MSIVAENQLAKSSLIPHLVSLLTSQDKQCSAISINILCDFQATRYRAVGKPIKETLVGRPLNQFIGKTGVHGERSVERRIDITPI